MTDIGQLLIERWEVDYGDGSAPEAVTVPHAWRQDLPVNSEGPVVYTALLEVPKTACKLRFDGVSYSAEVAIDGVVLTTHYGLWDAFDVPLTQFLGRRVEVKVTVTKNGGETFPVSEVASGFLPYVYHTFGGIYAAVRILDLDVPLTQLAPEHSRFHVLDSKMFVDGKPFYPRGLLHWGWYPELGHTNPPNDVIRNEVVEAKKLGFNLIKFCLWVPSHKYLEILKEEGMEAWLELPVWNPSPEKQNQERIAAEVEQIVRQFRRHDNILLWTIGCELGKAVSADFRGNLTQLVKNLTGSPLVKDDSGGAEMYGGDLREFGDFYDFHPYCDTEFYPRVLDDLLTGPRTRKPMLLGEFNDCDVHRDLARLGLDMPFWASNLSELNDVGVRWQHDLPNVLRSSRFSLNPTKEHHNDLMESSRKKALFIRKTVQEGVRARDSISGYVITGIRDTPISSAGFFDDWGTSRYSPDECAGWNGSACLFLIPTRQTPWIHGGNRPGFRDHVNHFVGQILLKVGIHSEAQLHSGLIWRIINSAGTTVEQGATRFQTVEALTSTEIAQIYWNCDVADEYTFEVEFGNAKNSWPLWVTDPFGEKDREVWTTHDSLELLGFHSHGGNCQLSTAALSEQGPSLVLLTGDSTIPKPFWREAAYEFQNSCFWSAVPFAEKWSRLLPISGDRVISPTWLLALDKPYEVLLKRIDTRTYEEHAVMVRFDDCFVTTLRPFGGLGVQPTGIPNNPAGVAFIRAIAKVLAG